MRNKIQMIVMVTLLSFAMGTLVMAGGLELKHYGFIKGDMVYATKGVLSFGAANLSAPQLASGGKDAALGFTAMHSRFGLKGTTGEKIKVGGLLELDFFGSGFDANVKPRIRLAYASMAKGNIELRFGQQWDLFSPNNPMTNNTNGILWFAGNKGFRRAQIQMHYKLPVAGLAPMLQLSVGEAAKEEKDLGDDNKATFPMLQGRLSAKLMEKHTLGVYFAYAKFSPLPDESNFDYNSSGFGVDFAFPFSSMLELKGEVNLGTNLNNANFFSLAGNGKKDDERKSLGLWVTALSKPSTMLNLVLGFGMDKNQTDNLAAGATEQNTVVYGDLIFPIGDGFSIALEAQSITTQIKAGDKNSALVLNLSGKIDF